MSAGCGDNSKKKNPLNICTFGTLQFTTPAPSVLTRCLLAGSLIQNLVILLRCLGRSGGRICSTEMRYMPAESFSVFVVQNVACCQTVIYLQV